MSPMTKKRPVDLSTVEAFLRCASPEPLSASQTALMVRNALSTRSLDRSRRRRIRPLIAVAAGILMLTVAAVTLHRLFAIGGDTTSEGTITLDTGDILRVSEDAHYAIASADSRHRRVEVQKGEIDFDVAPLGGGRRFTVNTPHCRIEVTGTRFAVRVIDDRSGIEVQEGTVDVYVDDVLDKRLVAGTQASFRNQTAHGGTSFYKREAEVADIPRQAPEERPSQQAWMDDEPVGLETFAERTQRPRPLTSHAQVKKWVADGDRARALRAIEAHLSRGKDRGPWLKVKGETLAAMGRYEEAAACLSSAAQRSKGGTAVLCGYLAADIYLSRLAKPQRALTLLSEVGATRPESPIEERSRVLEVKALLKLGRSAEAKSRAQQYLSRFPTSTAASWMRSVP